MSQKPEILCVTIRTSLLVNLIKKNNAIMTRRSNLQFPRIENIRFCFSDLINQYLQGFTCRGPKKTNKTQSPSDG